MPLVRVEVFEGELNQRQSQQLISKITDAVAQVTNEKLRGVTWVIVNEIRDGHWGVGGQTLGLDDVKRQIAD